MRPEEVELPPSPDPTGEVITDDARLTSSPSPLSSRPDTPQRAISADAIPSSDILSINLPYRPRNRSPLARGHLRSHSSQPSLSAPPMTRAHSSPTPEITGRLSITLKQGRPVSPLNASGRRRSPLRAGFEELYTGTPTWSGLNIEPNIPEHAELDTSSTSRLGLPDYDFGQSSPMHNTFPRVRRRPSSPLYQAGSAQNAFANPTTVSPSPRSYQSSPILNAQKYANEPYPSYALSASSVPSTPTSLRSRSPSISSLETIPDSPDAEQAAQAEVEELMKTRSAIAEGDDSDSGKEGGGSELRRKSSYGFSKEKRKRWSVCGAERRVDLDVIWED